MGLYHGFAGLVQGYRAIGTRVRGRRYSASRPCYSGSRPAHRPAPRSTYEGGEPKGRRWGLLPGFLVMPDQKGPPPIQCPCPTLLPRRPNLGLKGRYALSIHGVSKGQYANGDIHTNSIESFWALSKRGIVGQYHKVSAKHLAKYVVEFSYRHNNRHLLNLFDETLLRAVGGIK